MSVFSMERSRKWLLEGKLFGEISGAFGGDGRLVKLIFPLEILDLWQTRF